MFLNSYLKKKVVVKRTNIYYFEKKTIFIVEHTREKTNLFLLDLSVKLNNCIVKQVISDKFYDI